MNGPGVTMNGPGVTISGSGGQCTYSKLCYDKLNGSGCHQGLDLLRKRQLYALRLTLWAYFYIWHRPTMLRPIVMPGL